MAINPKVNNGARGLTNGQFIPGFAKIGTDEQWYPSNHPSRANVVNGVDMKNGVGSYPHDFQTIGLQEALETIRIRATMFEKSIAKRNLDDYRQFFERVVIPQHRNTLAMTFMKHTGIDDNPQTAALTGLNTWEPKWNEVTYTASQCEASTNAYGRFYKKHRFMDDISEIRWFDELSRMFAENAAITLNKLASIRLWEGANKIYVKSVAAFDKANPYAARLTLGATANDVAANLSWEALKEARYQMQNWYEEYTTVSTTDGELKHDNKRHVVIGGYSGDNYLVLVGYNGYNQLCSDPDFVDNFVTHSGVYATQVANGTLGIAAPIFNFIIQKTPNPLTIKKADGTVNTDGMGDLEVAFVVGGISMSRIGVELTLEGYTRMINVGYEEDKKVDPFGLLAFTGWMSVTDFTVIRNEALYAIPYVKQSYVIEGNPVAGKTPPWLA